MPPPSGGTQFATPIYISQAWVSSGAWSKPDSHLPEQHQALNSWMVSSSTQSTRSWSWLWSRVAWVTLLSLLRDGKQPVQLLTVTELCYSCPVCSRPSDHKVILSWLSAASLTIESVLSYTQVVFMCSCFVELRSQTQEIREASIFGYTCRDQPGSGNTILW